MLEHNGVYIQNFFQFDRVTYSTAALVLKTLSTKAIEKVKPVDQVSGLNHRTETSDYSFIGLLKQVSPCKETQSFCFKLEELTQNGLKTGGVFCFDVDNKTYNDGWFSHSFVRSAVSQNDKFIFIFEGVPFQILKRNKEIHFFLPSSEEKEAKILVKHFNNNSTVGRYLPNKPAYVTLIEATATVCLPRQRRTVYAIVSSIIKKPIVTIRGTAHGMFAIVDPSCYSNGVKRNTFTAQVFISSLKIFPTIRIGYALKLHQVATEQRLLNCHEVEFRVTRDEELIVFPNNYDGPLCPAERFIVNEEDVEVVSKLLLWYENLTATPAIPSMGPVGSSAVPTTTEASTHKPSLLQGTVFDTYSNEINLEEESNSSVRESSVERMMREIPSTDFIPQSSSQGLIEENVHLQSFELQEFSFSLRNSTESTNTCSVLSTPSFSDVVTSTQKEAFFVYSGQEPLDNICSIPRSPSSCEEVSVIPLSSPQTDLEDMFVKSTSNVNHHLIEDPNRFQIVTRIKSILPCDPTTNSPAGLGRLLVAFCQQCKQLLKYENFKDSTSTRIFRKFGKVKSSRVTTREIFNYLCSEEDHERNMNELIDNENVDLSRYEDDESVFLDKTFMFICPFCKFRGLPDTLCQLEPIFFFQLHLTNLTNIDVGTCLCVWACGIHAEFLLGTKANHALRSPEVWKRAEKRLAKLLENQLPLRLSLRKNPHPPNEVYLENTCVVYDNYHLLPF